MQNTKLLSILLVRYTSQGITIMLNKSIISAFVGAGSLFFSTICMAETSDISKDEWLDKLKELVPAMICKSFTENEGANKQLLANNIDYDKCVKLIPTSFDKCQKQYYAEIPATISNESAEKWGSSIGQCIGSDFAATNLSSSGSSTSTTSTSSTSSPSSSTSEPLTKDAWLSSIKLAVPPLICKGFLQDEGLGKQLKKQNIDYDKCVSLIPASIDKCQTELYSSMPATINQVDADKWGNTLGECIGKDFAVKYLL